ncbi:MAG: alpha/beta hydrolase [Actinomycetota bacterium]|nr:alpha/beta hydrolase [Actinomycetota bacterium]
MPSFATRQLVTAGLAANALRPVPGRYTAIPSFFAGWLAGELAPQLLALTALDTAGQVGRRRASTRDLAIAALAAAGLAVLVKRAYGVGALIETALRESIGEDYQERLSAVPTRKELATPWREVARPFRMKKQQVERIADIGYTAGGRRARLDIYRPRGGKVDGEELKGAPVLVQVHGGAWILGSKEQQGQLLMNQMAARGWVCVAINYRLAPKHPFPAQIIDTKKALAWVKEHIASYGGDPSYIVVTGGSAGGHLAALAALTPGDPAYQPGFENADTSVSACVPFYGVYDMAGATGDPAAVAMRDGFLAPVIFKEKADDAHIADFERASPLLNMHPDAPDFFVLHGERDTLVSVEQARAFVQKLRETSNSSVTYAELPGTQHAFEVFSSIRSQHTIKAVARWLEWHHAGQPAVMSESVSGERD